MEKVSIYFKKIRIEIIYYTVNIIFLYSLNKFNNTLLSISYGEDWRSILEYDEFKVLMYFIATVILLIIGVLLCRNRFRMIKREDLEINDVLLYIISILITIIFIVVLINFIESPIIRIIISGLTALAGWMILIES